MASRRLRIGTNECVRIIVAGGHYEKHKTAAVAGCAFCRIDRLRRGTSRGLEARRPIWHLQCRQGLWAYEIEKGHFYWVGEFSGTFFSDKGEKGLFDHAGVKCPGWEDSNNNNKTATAGGECIITDLDGDQAYLTWRGAGTPSRLPGTFDYTGGTGKYKDIKGSNTFVGNVTVSWPDGTGSGFSAWNR
jgi:hypothetical protein